MFRGQSRLLFLRGELPRLPKQENEQHAAVRGLACEGVGTSSHRRMRLTRRRRAAAKRSCWNRPASLELLASTWHGWCSSRGEDREGS